MSVAVFAQEPALNDAVARQRFCWPVGATRELPVPQAEAWALLAQAGGLALAHPYCAHNPVRQWPGVGARDEVHYLNGLCLERHFCRWHEGQGYALEIGVRDGPRSYVRWQLQALDSQRCELGIKVYPYLLQKVPRALRWLPYQFRIAPLLRRYLRAVCAGYAWVLTRQTPVRPNQFGAHPWFS
ncbi:MAG: hypothetical protein HRU51_06040 [Xanthomonadales bacterium]|nr:hypothetical protein [Xanthomonadales bacterium]